MARRKPYDPADLARREVEKRERAAELERLISMGATITTDQVGRIASARLSNPFNLLLMRRTITLDQYLAADWLIEEWAAWKGKDGKRDSMAEAVDGGSGCADLVTDRMLKAGRVVNALLAHLTITSRKLTEAFMEAVVEEDRPMVWRGIVQRETGEKDETRQTKAFVAMTEELRSYRQEPRKAAA